MPEYILDNVKNIYCVGIKGTGLSAMAAFLCTKGFNVTGSDTDEIFSTEKILKEFNIKYFESFDSKRINNDIDLIIYSTAYNPEEHPELVKAKETGIMLMTYPEILGLLSRDTFAVGISGVNGKTSMTAICASLAESCSLEVSLICGSGMNSFGGSPFLNLGDRFFIAETCEYRNSFLNFSPDIILVTNIELDHTDFFKNIDDVKNSFYKYLKRLPEGGTIIYCADDPVLGKFIKKVRNDFRRIEFIAYGFKAENQFRILDYKSGEGIQNFKIEAYDDYFSINVPGRHNVINACGAIAVICRLLQMEHRLDQNELANIARGLEDFKGTKRRAEIYGEASGIIFMDDYGHHPTAIKTTLEGLISFFPGRKIIIDFMPHTYTRTEALLQDFASSFDNADIVVLNKIYASARERQGAVDGRVLYEKTAEKHKNTVFCPEFENAFNYLKKTLKSGDLFITMGAGDNWKLCRDLYEHFRSSRKL